MGQRKTPKVILIILIFLWQTSTFQTPPAQGVAWSAGNSITPPVYLDSKPYVIEDAQGFLWAVYESTRSTNPDIYTRKWNGVSWLPEERLTNNTSKDVNPAIVQLVNGTVLLVWVSNRPGTDSLYGKRYNSGVWSSEGRITYPTGGDSTPSLLQLRNGTLILSWTRQSVSGQTLIRDVYYKTYYNGVWSSDTALINSSFSEYQPSLMQTDDSTVVVVYGSDKPGNYDVYYKALKAGALAVRLTTNTDDDREPWVMQDLNGTIWAFWGRCVKSGQVCQGDIFYRFSTNLGVSWSPETKFTQDPTGEEVFDSEPSAIHARDRRIYLFWTTDLGGGSFDIYYSTSDTILIHNVIVGPLTVPEDKPRRGETFAFSVPVENHGDYVENVALNVTVDGTSIGLTSITLQPGGTATYSYSWGSAGQALGLHTLEAAVGQVLGEGVTSDNAVSFDFHVVSAGDVNKDGDVNFLDLGEVGGAFLSQAGDSRFDPRADLNPDGRIDFLDLGTSGSTFGQSVVLPPDFNVAASTYIVKVSQGSSKDVSVSVESISGFNSPVVLTTTGFGGGLTAAFSTNPVTAPGSSLLTLAAGPEAATGTFTITVTGSGGMRVRALSVTLVVTPPGTFNLTVQPSSLKLALGGSAQSTMTLFSTNDFNSPVTLTASGLPAGLQVSFDPNPVTPPPNGVITSTLNFAANSTVSPGTYTVTVYATSGGVIRFLDISIEICTPLQADVNHDGFVNFLDLGRIAAAFLTSSGQPGFDPDADVNKDGAINFLDLAIVGAEFMKQC